MKSSADDRPETLTLTDFWPLFGLRLRTPRLVLAPLVDDDLVELLQVVLGGIHPPDQMPFDFPWTQVPREELISNTLKFYWQRRVVLAPDNWTIVFGVRHDGRMIGLQELSATDFTLRRTVETGSYLGLPFHSQGFGSEMRAAVTMFAFDHLGAVRAESAAFADNPASQRVSEKLGYQPNGQQLKKRREGEVITSLGLLLTPDTIIRPPWELVVEGLDACRSVLGAAVVE